MNHKAWATILVTFFLNKLGYIFILGASNCAEFMPLGWFDGLKGRACARLEDLGISPHHLLI